MQQAVNSSLDLNNSALINTGGQQQMMGRQHVSSKNAAKQFLNTSFDASKSANTINYVGSAYMSTNPSHHGVPSAASGVPPGAKISKVGLKHSSGNSRQQANNIHAPGNNYTDGTAIFLGYPAAR
jgi:hypothetical protein